ncbi:MAG: hypothetical protein JSV95_00415 [Gemmatimonadota bacterium]|nr:MAG: hypothetical protein JSV95_00415 [Gemmatimonadota bacterium]
MRMGIACLLAAAGLAWTACGESESGSAWEGMTINREDMPQEVAVLIDAGNSAFSAGNLEAARRHYLGAAALDSTVAAAWYGVAMAERALGNEAAADSALARVMGLGGPAAVHHPAPDPSDGPRTSPHGAPVSPHGAPTSPHSGSPVRDSAGT